MPSRNNWKASAHHVYQKHVRGKKTLYLDQTVWIEIRDCRTKEAAECGEVCYRAVRAGTAIFPLSSTLVEEFYGIGWPKRRRQAADLLMDLSCEGVTYNLRRTDEINHMLSHWHAAEADANPRICFQYLSHRDRRIDLRRVARYDEHCNDLNRKLRTTIDTALQQGADLPEPETRKSQLRRFRLETYEREVHPELAKRPKALQRLVEDDPLRAVERLPAQDLQLRLYCQYNFARGPKLTRNDITDLFHSSVAPAYADVFVSLDREQMALLRAAVAQGVDTTRAVLLASIADLTAWVKAHCEPRR